MLYLGLRNAQCKHPAAMAFATSLRGSYRCERTTTVVPCARRKSLAASVATLLAAAPALAEVPSLEGLDVSSYDAFTSGASAKFAGAASQATNIDLSGLQDAGPLVAGLATGVVLVGGAIAFATNSAQGPKIQSLQAAKALSLLEDDPAALLLDIRPKDNLKEDGTPDLRSAKKSSISLPYKPSTGDASAEGTVVVGWADRVAKMKKVTEGSVIVLFDVDGKQSAAAAKDLSQRLPEVSAVFYVAGGSAGWLAQELPWREPMKLPALNFDTLKSLDLTGVSAGTEKLVEKYKENPTIVNGAVAATAVAGASVFLFTEIEAILQVVGIVFALQFLARKLLFAQDRQQLLFDLKTLINEKIGAGDAGEDLRRLASAVLDAEAPEDIADAAQSASNSADKAVPENVASAREWINAWREKQKTAVMA